MGAQRLVRRRSPTDGVDDLVHTGHPRHAGKDDVHAGVMLLHRAGGAAVPHHYTIVVLVSGVPQGAFDDPSRGVPGENQGELVASFVNRSNPLKSWEKNRHRRGQCIRSVQAKKRGDQAHSGLILCHGSPPFF